MGVSPRQNRHLAQPHPRVHEKKKLSEATFFPPRSRHWGGGHTKTKLKYVYKRNGHFILIRTEVPPLHWFVFHSDQFLGVCGFRYLFFVVYIALHHFFLHFVSYFASFLPYTVLPAVTIEYSAHDACHNGRGHFFINHFIAGISTIAFFIGFRLWFSRGQVVGGVRFLVISMHGRSRTTIDPLIHTMPERSTSGLHRPGRHR